METVKRILALQLFLVLSGALLTALAGEQHLLLTVKKSDYAKVQKTIEGLGGTVHFAYKYCEMLAATVPEDAVATIIAHPAVTHAMKDQDFTLSDPPAWGRPTLQIPSGPGLQACLF